MMNIINIRAKYHNKQTGKTILLPIMLTRNRLLTILSLVLTSVLTAVGAYRIRLPRSDSIHQQ